MMNRRSVRMLSQERFHGHPRATRPVVRGPTSFFIVPLHHVHETLTRLALGDMFPPAFAPHHHGSRELSPYHQGARGSAPPRDARADRRGGGAHLRRDRRPHRDRTIHGLPPPADPGGRRPRLRPPLWTTCAVPGTARMPRRLRHHASSAALSVDARGRLMTFTHARRHALLGPYIDNRRCIDMAAWLSRREASGPSDGRLVNEPATSASRPRGVTETSHFECGVLATPHPSRPLSR